ncbi:hypothetical protein G5B47_15205 [Paenibacillus sp. 7124]|uniref:Uncharacterized protein n=1 Tax=Paenibacillus apii TaxID=1850370 RepID=A0A6M1PMQ9_9BACL|nr:hypothetical protein [Paenibacillus apii]NGM83768.1 hypothetical protein [Paenibacillus apii]
MKKRSLIIILVISFLLYGGYQGYEYYNDHFVDQRIIQNILERNHYAITKKDTAVKLDLSIKPEWIPFETEKPQNLNIKIAESHNTNILLQQVWNRGNDIYFSFHTTYDLNFNKGKFLYNMLLNDDGTYTTKGSPEDFQLTDLHGSQIQIGQTGYGPGSDFSFGIDPSEYERIRNGFNVRYSGMILYEYSRK